MYKLTIYIMMMTIFFNSALGKSINTLIDEVNSGNPEAQIRLGDAFIEQYSDEKTALQWYKKAADQNNPEGLFLTGLYNDNFAESLIFFEKAAELGHVKATHLTISFYKNGRKGVPQDFEKAFKWQKRLVEIHPTSGAIESLANYYFDGLGVQKNVPKAYELYFKAIEIEDPSAIDYIPLFSSYIKLGDYYFHVDKDYKKAMYWYKKALAITNFSKANHMVGRMYYSGLGVEQDYLEAINYFSKSPKYDESKNMIGVMYALGQGFDQNNEKAYKIFYQLCNEGKGFQLSCEHLKAFKTE